MAVRRWRREGDGSLVIGDGVNGATVREVWEGRNAGKFTIIAWRGATFRKRGRRYFPREGWAARVAMAFLRAT
jgi:hypothetical protein